jgi:hypothetical protein
LGVIESWLELVGKTKQTYNLQKTPNPKVLLEDYQLSSSVYSMTAIIVMTHDCDSLMVELSGSESVSVTTGKYYFNFTTLREMPSQHWTNIASWGWYLIVFRYI